MELNSLKCCFWSSGF